MPDLRTLARKVVSADYGSKYGVTLKLDCGHKVYVQGFPRSPIPRCFSMNCKECAH